MNPFHSPFLGIRSRQQHHLHWHCQLSFLSLWIKEYFRFIHWFLQFLCDYLVDYQPLTVGPIHCFQSDQVMMVSLGSSECFSMICQTTILYHLLIIEHEAILFIQFHFVILLTLKSSVSYSHEDFAFHCDWHVDQYWYDCSWDQTLQLMMIDWIGCSHHWLKVWSRVMPSSSVRYLEAETGGLRHFWPALSRGSLLLLWWCVFVSQIADVLVAWADGLF